LVAVVAVVALTVLRQHHQAQEEVQEALDH
jgi:hypothetical protein